MTDLNEQQNYTQPQQSMFGSNNMEQPVKPDNYLVLAIVATVLGLCSCFGLILGIIAIVYSTQVDSKYNLGDYIGAQSSSKNAKTFSIVSFVVTGVGLVISIIYYAVMGAAVMSQLNY